MADKFDRSQAKLYFTRKFLKNHIYIGGPNAKKRAEEVFQRRKEKISTVLCLTKQELIQLAGEIHGNQDEYSRNPRKQYTTDSAYDFWSRGGDQSKDKQRATLKTARFKYNVHRVGELYVIGHFEG